MNVPKLYNKNSYHHLYNRGANKGLIFLDENDYKFFLKKIKEFQEKYSIGINCYCLLPNHFHLFAKQLSDEHPLGKFIGDLTNSYTKAINKKYSRTGVLFQGRTKSKLIIDENYFTWLYKYILCNPVKAGLVNHIEEWEYSSAKEYMGLSSTGITQTSEILNRFNSVIDFKDFIISEEKKFDYSIFF